jgi:hypothetical protein
MSSTQNMDAPETADAAPVLLLMQQALSMRAHLSRVTMLLSLLLLGLSQ